MRGFYRTWRAAFFSVASAPQGFLLTFAAYYVEKYAF
jgi:hypothetical protein